MRSEAEKEQGRLQLYQLKGMLSDLPPEKQVEVKRLKESLEKIIGEDKELGLIALAMVGLEESTHD